MAAVDFKQAFTQIVLDDKEDWDRSQSVGASEVFGCHRRSYFAKREPEHAEEPENPDDIEFGYAERGNFIEAKYVVPKLKKMFGEDKCFLMGEDQQTMYDGRLSATPDGMIIDQPRDALSLYGIPDLGYDGACFPPEIKSFDPRMNLSAGAKPRHVGQSIVQQGMFRKSGNYKPDYGCVIYVNASNLKDVRAFGTTFDQDIYDRAKARAEDVFDLKKSAKDYKPEGKLTGECTTCPFPTRCSQVETERFPDQIVPLAKIAEDVIKETEALTREVAALRAEHTALEKVKKAKEAELKERLIELETNRMGRDDWSVSLSMNGGKRTLDKELMLADGLDPEKYMRDGFPYTTLRTNVNKKPPAERKAGKKVKAG